MTTGERIKQSRKQLGLSAEKLAAKININPATVYRWEKGDIEKVPAAMLEPLANALQTTPEYLMGWETPENKDDITDQDLAAFAQDFSRLPAEKQKQVLDYMRFLLSTHE